MLFSLYANTQREREKKGLIYPPCFAREQVIDWRGKRKFMYLHAFGRRALDYFIVTKKTSHTG